MNSSKKQTSKKKSPKKTNRFFKKRNTKPKVKLDSSKVLWLFVAILICCVILLLATMLLPVEQNEPIDFSLLNQRTEQIQKEQKGKKQQTQKEKTKPQNESEKPKTNVSDQQKAPKIEKAKKNDEVEKKVDETQAKEQTQKEKTQTDEQPKIIVDEKIEKFSKEIPLANSNAKIVFVFDDGGQNLTHLKKFLSLPFPITVAVLPKLQHSKESGNLIRASKNEVMLHQPMQSINLKINPGPGAIMPEMSSAEITSLVEENIKEVGPIVGINNHEGSLITEDEVRIGAVMNLANDKNIFFLDSRTSSQTRVPQVAMSMGYGYYQRDVFLDNEKSKDNILSELKRGLAIANKKGAVIMIGHIWSFDVLPEVLLEVYPVLLKKGYKFSTVSKSGALIRP